MNRLKNFFSISGRAKGNLFMISVFLLVILFFLISACEHQRMQTVKSIEYEPVYMSQQEFAGSVAMEEPRELNKPGKMVTVESAILQYDYRDIDNIKHLSTIPVEEE